MPLANGSSNAFLGIDGLSGSAFASGKDCFVNVCRRMAAGSPHDDLILVLVPLEHGSGDDSKLPSNLGRH